MQENIISIIVFNDCHCIIFRLPDLLPASITTSSETQDTKQNRRKTLKCGHVKWKWHTICPIVKHFYLCCYLHNHIVLQIGLMLC